MGPQIEIVNVRDFLLEHKDQLKFYMNLHSYGEMVLLPWGYTYEKPDNIDQLTEVATLGADAMRAGYRVGIFFAALSLIHSSEHMSTSTDCKTWHVWKQCYIAAGERYSNAVTHKRKNYLIEITPQVIILIRLVVSHV